jgi:hypothetical protein
MTPEEAARATAGAIGELASRFMLDGATYRYGGELGFDGIDFYVVGRGGALGDVDPSVVSAVFVYFNPDAVAEQWERGVAVMAPRDAARRFATACHTWAQAHLPQDGLDYRRLAELAGFVSDGASVSGAPLFAGWRRIPEPTEPRALALHRLNGLRELRAALHGAAVLASGLKPLEALMVRTPLMAPVFGWHGELPDPEPHRARWEEAEQVTHAMMCTVLAPLDPDQRAEFADLLGAAATVGT